MCRFVTRRRPEKRVRHGHRAICGAAAAGLVALLAFASTPEPLSVTVQARSIAPGEPMRVRVHSVVPLTELTGEFLGREVTLLSDGDATRWSGWTMVGLEEEPGAAAIELSGIDVAGNPVDGSRVVTVEPRQFPEERLAVSSEYVEPPPEVQERLARERAKLAMIYRTRSGGLSHERPFVRPVPGEPTSIFGLRRFFNDQPRDPHPGLDLRAATGTPVAAAGPGTVVLTQDLYYAGNTVIVDHGGGLFTI
jgi:murein DD-endopeptidase MepM/ murein hydrolase activator NlpD